MELHTKIKKLRKEDEELLIAGHAIEVSIEVFCGLTFTPPSLYTDWGKLAKREYRICVRNVRILVRVLQWNNDNQIGTIIREEY